MDQHAMPSRFIEEVPKGLPVGEDWVETASTETIQDVWLQHSIAEVAEGTKELACTALDVAESHRTSFAKTSGRDRKSLIQACATKLADRSEELVDLLIIETGKPRKDCRTEVHRTLSCWEAAAEEVGREQGELVPVDLQPGGEDMVAWYRRVPLGVVVGIAGFNYPLLLASHKVAPALAVGAPVILKPAPAAPLSVLWLTALIRVALQENSLSPGIVQCITGGPEVGHALVSDDRAAVVSFTGSAQVGHTIAASAAPRKTVLELGSSAAMIVTGSANLDEVIDAVVRGGFYANGQACIAIQRLIVLEDVDASFEDRVREAVANVQVGDPWDGNTDVGALIDKAARDRVVDQIDDALRHGARKLAERPISASSGAPPETLVAPQVLVDVPADHPLWEEEIFAPVVCLRRVSDFNEAIRVANNSRYGLQASIYTSDLAEAHVAIDSLEVGGVVVNQVPGFRSDVMPYGGFKDSGVGREGPRWAAKEYTATRMALVRIPKN